MIEGGKDIVYSDFHEDQILKDADVSPRVSKSVKKSKKGKKKKNIEKSLPSRSGPKRGSESSLN